MATTNLFLNPYEQPENKLSYSFLCLLEHLSIEAACSLLSKIGIPVDGVKSFEVNLLYGGGKGNPDGSIRIVSDSDEVAIFLENKTWRASLDLDQIRRHLAQHLDGEPGSLLLVVTSEHSDHERLAQMADARLRFSTWHEMTETVETLAQSVTDQADRLLLSQFAEYLEKSGEAWRARMLDRKVIDSFSQILSYRDAHAADEYKFKNETWRLLDSLKDQIRAVFEKEIQEVSIGDHWGRIGVECTLLKQPLEQWVGFGVYYDPSDHKVPLKAKYQPEFAVFFDMQPRNREKLAKAPGVQAAIDQLRDAGYEFNFPNAPYNRWRVCFWREPMTSRVGADLAGIRQMFEERLRALFDSRFYQTAKNL